MAKVIYGPVTLELTRDEFTALHRFLADTPFSYKKAVIGQELADHLVSICAALADSQ